MEKYLFNVYQNKLNFCKHMEKINMRLLILLNFFIGIVLSQTVELSDISSLSEDAKREYFRSHLVVKQGGFGKKTYSDWTVYQGLDNQLKTEEFFSLVGYEPENSDFSKRTKWPWEVFRYIGILGGYTLMSNIDTGDEYYDQSSYEYVQEDDEYPTLVPGILFFAGGLYSHWFLINNPQIMQYEAAKQIANDYNKKLIKNL